MADENISQTSLDSTKNSKDALFDKKPKPKLIRILTVLAYVLSVSMAAIFLSIYYIFIWHGEPHLGARRMISVNYSEQESETGLKKIIEQHAISNILPPQALIFTIQTNDGDFNDSAWSFNYSSTEEAFLENNTSSISDMQQQLTALETLESETKHTVPTTTVTTEENTTTWQYEYPDSNEDLPRASSFLKKLMDTNDDNY